MTDQTKDKARIFISIGRASEILNCSSQATRQRARRGCFQMRRIGNRVEIALDDILGLS